MVKNIYLALALMCSGLIASAQFSKDIIDKGDSVADHYKGHELNDFRTLSIKLTRHLENDVSKARAIYRWICTNIQNDTRYFKKAERLKSKLGHDSPAFAVWSKQNQGTIIDRLIRKKKTICNGYSYLFRELAFHADLKAVILNGYSRTSKINTGESEPVPNHSWNSILINENWYFVDTTWGSGYIDEFGSFQFKFNAAHFCTKPIIFAQTHFPIDSSWIISSGAQTLKEYVNQPLVFSTATNFGLTTRCPDQFKTTITKGTPVNFHFTFQNSTLPTNPILKVSLRNELNKVLPLKYQQLEKGLEMTSSWTPKATGTYSVDLLLGDVVTCRWKVQVKKPEA